MNRPVKRVAPKGMSPELEQRERETGGTVPGVDGADGRFEITVSEDRMRVFITLAPSGGGGSPLAVERVRKSLAVLKVVFGVNEELLKRLIETVERTKDEKKGVIIAQGLLPEEGKDGGIKFHFKEGGSRPGKTEQWGGADKDRVQVRAGYAHKGDLIASIVKSVPGKDGKDVLGNPVPAPRVSEPKLLAGINIRVDKGCAFYMGVDGIAEVFRDEKGVHTLSGRPYSDGKFSIRIPDGDMTVLMDVRPSFGGGEPVDPSEVLDECRRQGVAVPLDEARIREAVDRAEKELAPVENVPVASGEPPVHGRDGGVQLPVRFATGSRLRHLKDGSVDYKEQDLYTTVEKGTIVAEVTEPGKAVRNGRSVKGKIVEARDGREAVLVAGNNTLVQGYEGSSRYIAAIDGRLFFDGKSVSIEPVMLIEGDVGPKTGNVRFNGVVEITGDVLDGYRVYGKKGLIIRGNVGNAHVTSEDSITVFGGVIGKGGGVISAGRDVLVKFAENARVEARGDIVVHSAAMNCSMLSGQRIVAVKEKGQLVGGELRARLGVVARTLGNDSEHRTEVFAGSDFFVERTLFEVREKIEGCATEIKALDLALEKASRRGKKPDRKPGSNDERSASQPTGPLQTDSDEMQKKRTALLAEAEGLKRIENECLLKLEEVFDAQVLAQETLFMGVRVRFGKAVYEPDGTRTKVKITYDKEQRRIDIGRM